ncbi:MAG TPA: RES family NAD+ phosphorylase [Longimicrobium sp.]|nr:RES family NAD+ phosphorylase [Longimicrobium sp.]
MRLWRITRRAYQALDGEGARLYGGRWNAEGVAVVYTSATLSLAALEYLVHVQIEDVPVDLVALEIEVPDRVSVQDVSPAELPSDWNRVEDHPACSALGDRWARAGDSLVLRVPSAVIPHERNLLLNPRHPQMEGVSVVSAEPFSFDPRLPG